MSTVRLIRVERFLFAPRQFPRDSRVENMPHLRRLTTPAEQRFFLPARLAFPCHRPWSVGARHVGNVTEPSKSAPPSGGLLGPRPLVTRAGRTLLELGVQPPAHSMRSVALIRTARARPDGAFRVRARPVGAGGNADRECLMIPKKNPHLAEDPGMRRDRPSRYRWDRRWEGAGAARGAWRSTTLSRTAQAHNYPGGRRPKRWRRPTSPDYRSGLERRRRSDCRTAGSLRDSADNPQPKTALHENAVRTRGPLH